MQGDEISVLLVDDEVALANTLAQRLQMRSMRVGTAYSGEEALSKLLVDKPDVIVLDLRMPGMQGMDVLREIKKVCPRVQVIVLTGHGTDKDEEEARKLGGFDFLRKPADIDMLAHRIKAAFKGKHPGAG